MPNIGERLEEARKRQGISLREAAEATKIRSDFLLNYESNNFEFDMPEVYRRGFLKLYASFLKMDVEKVMTDYNAVLLGSSQLARRENKEFFGRMDLPEKTKPIGGAESNPPFGAHNPPPEPKTESSAPPANPIDTQSDASLYWKIGAIFLGGFVIVGLITLLIQTIFSSGDSDPQKAPTATETTVTQSTNGNSSTPATSEEVGSFRIIANGDVLNVMVRQDKDREKLFGRSMTAGEEVEITREGPVRVVSSDIDKITIELDGRKITSPSSGIGQIKLGMDGAEN